MSNLKPINPEIWMDEQFLRMTKDAKSLFIFVLSCSDDEGCTECNKACEISRSDPMFLDELISNGFVTKIYEDESATIVYINRWHELNPDMVEDGEPSIWHDYIPLSAFT